MFRKRKSGCHSAHFFQRIYLPYVGQVLSADPQEWQQYSMHFQLLFNCFEMFVKLVIHQVEGRNKFSSHVALRLQSGLLESCCRRCCGPPSPAWQDRLNADKWSCSKVFFAVLFVRKVLPTLFHRENCRICLCELGP